MANRELQGGRTVGADVAVKLPDADVSTEQMFHSIAELGQNIIKENQQAKITENFSAAQIDINQMAMKYQTEYEGDPFGGMKKFQEERDKIIEGYGNDISPFFKKPWQQDTRRLAMTNDAAMETWAYKQTKVNTVTAINRSIKNNMSQALVDGQNFGNSDEDEIGSLVNFGQSKAQLIGFADKNLGSETATKMLEDYDGDYLKSFMSGVSDSNPLKALRLMERDDVKASFKDQKQYASMKEAIENRALNVQKINGEKQVLNTLRDENSVLAKSLEAPISYADLQEQFAKTNMSPYAQSYFMKANGYTKTSVGGSKAKLTGEQKDELKQSIFSRVIGFGKADAPITSEDIKALQSDIYKAADQGAITKAETAQWTGQILTPYIAQKENDLSQFSDNAFIADDLGLKGLQEAFDESIAIVPEEDQTLGPLSQKENSNNRIRLYDTYMGYLGKEAQGRGVAVGDIPKLDRDTRRTIYAKAQQQAIKSYNAENYPEFQNMKEVPNAVIPVINNPSDLQPEYKSKDGGKITADQIQETARNRGISTTDVLKLLRQNGVIVE